ncbi:hypothetical protein GGI23_004477 [Coemansia sp. RSA 2559]|nr:hypothetical protein GGI23_004477 [Coemansia sp. RSA 2559]
MKTEIESLYGSSIYRGSQSVDDVDLPEYMQLCRRLFPELMSEESDHAGLEAEENLAKYLKYLTGLPLPSLKIEPTLLQNDLQRISNELTMLLLNETAKPQSSASLKRRSESTETQKQPTHHLARQIDRHEPEGDDNAKAAGLYRTANSDDGDLRIFNVVYETGKAASLAIENIGSSLNEAQEALSRLEAACESFSAEMSHLDQRTKAIQRVLDKQDIITRIVELPRVMRMCVAGGYYEEAVEIAEHVRVTGDRLVRDIRDGVGTLPGSLGDSDGAAVFTPASKEQLIGFVGSIQRQVHAEFEHMVVDLCRELGYTRLTTAGSVQATGKKQIADSLGHGNAGAASGGGGDDDGYEKSIKRLSHVAKIVAILRSVGMFTEPELRLLYLRSRWQAWLQTAETLSGFAPAVVFASTEDPNRGNADTRKGAPGASCIMAFSPDSSRLSHVPEKNNTSSAEVSAYLEKLINAYLSWLAEADMHYRTLFARNQPAELSDALDSNDLATDPLTDLATFGSRRFLSSTLPIFDLLTDASGISSLQLLVATHARKLSQSNVDFVTPFLEQRLEERAFASIVCGIEEAASEASRKLAALRDSTLGVALVGDSRSKEATASVENANQTWEQLAVSTRPSLALPPDGFDTSLAGSPSAFLGQYRISPVGLLQYPLLAQLLHSFRDSLHTLRILVLAGDSARSKDSGTEVLTLLTMASIVLESELARIADALASLCASVLDVPTDGRRNAKQSASDKAKDSVRHACVAFVFGLARSVAEIFEEIASLSEEAAAAGLCSEGDESSVTLYSQTIYRPLLRYLL